VRSQLLSPAKRRQAVEHARDKLGRGVPDHIRSDNGSEFTAKRVREWLERVGLKTLSIEPGSPWENGYVESYNGKLRSARPCIDAQE